MNMQNRILKHFIFLGLAVGLVGCGNMEANIEQPTGAWEETSRQFEKPLQELYANEESEEVVMEQSPSTTLPVGPATVSTPGTVNKSETKTETKVEQAKPETSKPEVKPVLNGPGVLKPTVYYFVVVNEDKNGCAADAKKDLHGAGGKVLLKVCPKTWSACSLQGSCAVIQKGKTHTFNIIGRFGDQERFFEIEEDGCRYGYGVNSSCLDPFYTLAADLSIYKPGEVIYVPAVVGLQLPDGSKHDGYFVIRDKGRGIIGRGRFDFFTGYYSWIDSNNPFKKLGLGDVKTNIPYFRVTGHVATEVLERRAYPNLPEK
ncbi:3D domain-containing protein [Bdellovibrio sp. ArHS]|uniref:3D domain-containing protein n=1 Tax=Bdellovibrio sp. ArHS TaxID=1569284 RepID=UPI000AFC1F23|nr:3D domain-containing protein [Bdellovibrio sp. ArHS]